MAASEKIHLLELSKFENNCKTFQQSSAGVLLEKVIRKNYEMFRHETSMRKPFFSKATCSSTKKKITPYTFSLKISKSVQKKNKNFQKSY